MISTQREGLYCYVMKDETGAGWDIAGLVRGPAFPRDAGSKWVGASSSLSECPLEFGLALGYRLADIDLRIYRTLGMGGYRDGPVCRFSTNISVCMMMEVRKMLISARKGAVSVSRTHGTSVQSAPAASVV
jgi:hypothetical protein